jgi:membrane-associated phospholipid phosphatase
MSAPLRMLALTTLMSLAVGACDTRTGPDAAAPDVAGAEVKSVKFWEAGATVAWNALAVDLTGATAVDAGRLHLYLGLAQLRAAEAAQASAAAHPPIGGAIGGASAAVLTAFFPASEAQIEAALDAQAAAESWPGAKHQDFAAGEAIGRAAAARVLAYAATDGVGLTDPGTPPLGEGFWMWTGGPIARGPLGARPIFLASGDEFRPGPPPAFGSAQFTAALAEVRQISDTRTPEQLAIALFWNVNQSPRSNAAFMEIARDLIVSHRRSDTEAARIMFLMGAASFDALIGCFEAKYHYWFIRPPQADPGIVTTFPTPPHPSYPSAHSCSSGALSGVLAAIFPSEARRLAAVAEESSLSRLYAGIHYRFDMEAGLALGRAVAAKALGADLDEVAVP